MSERFVRMNDPPDDVTDTGLGMMFAFERSVVVVGVVEQATVINVAAEAIIAMIVFSVFKGVLFSVYTILCFCRKSGGIKLMFSFEEQSGGHAGERSEAFPQSGRLWS